MNVYEYSICIYGLVAIGQSDEFMARWAYVIEDASRFIENRDISKVVLTYIVRVYNYILIIYYCAFIFIHTMVLITYILIAFYFWSWNGLSWMGSVVRPKGKLEEEEVENFWTRTAPLGDSN